MPTTLTPYLGFNGNTREAFAFYAQALCARIDAMLTFDDLGGGITRYTARARHWTTADREAHEKMGFHEGWGQCTSQLAELAALL